MNLYDRKLMETMAVNTANAAVDAALRHLSFLHTCAHVFDAPADAETQDAAQASYRAAVASLQTATAIVCGSI